MATIFCLRQSLKHLRYIPRLTTVPPARSEHSSSGSDKERKVYELRNYIINYHGLKQFLAVSEKGLPMRMAHSPLVGYWTAELGGISEVVHIWEFDSLVHRAKVRSALSVDKEWQQQCIEKLAAYIQRQKNITMTLLPNTELKSTETTGMYELQTLSMSTPACMWLPVLQRVLDDLSGATKDSTLLGAFNTVHGPVNTAVLLWQHSNFDQGIELRAEMDKHPLSPQLWSQIRDYFSKGLISFAKSPLK